MRYSFLAFIFTLSFSYFSIDSEVQRSPTQTRVQRSSYNDYDYKKIYKYTRDFLTDKKINKFIRDTLRGPYEIEQADGTIKKVKIANFNGVSETDFITLVRNNYEFWDEVKSFITGRERTNSRAIKKELVSKMRELAIERQVYDDLISNDKVEPVVIEGKNGAMGYKNVNLFVSHDRKEGRKTVKADNLVKVWKDFIKGAKKEIWINLYEFDLEEIADLLIEKQRAGVQVHMGLYKHTYEHNEKSKALFHKLSDAGVFIHKVDSTGLNHQKMGVRDPFEKGKSKVLIGSANVTQSGSSPDGDLPMVPKSRRPPNAIPNANHILTMEGGPIAATIHHEISKTIDPNYQLVGKEYPLGGIYKFLGTSNGSKHLLLAFTPNGAGGNLAKNFYSPLIEKTKGPVHMAQFVYSNNDFKDALFERAQRELEETGDFKFFGVGEARFSTIETSGFLEMIGMEKAKNEDGVTIWREVENRWTELLGREKIEQLREKVRIGPLRYDDSYFQVGDEKIYVTSFMHHKFMVTGNYSTLGSSFNMSNSAESNVEQILAIHDKDLAKKAKGIVTSLLNDSERSVYDEALRKTQSSLEDVVEELARIRAAEVKALNLDKPPTLWDTPCNKAIADFF